MEILTMNPVVLMKFVIRLLIYFHNVKKNQKQGRTIFTVAFMQISLSEEIGD